MKKMTGWAIENKGNGLYVDWRTRRKDMIEAHTSSLGETWKDCRRNGDRCIKITITKGW